MVTSVSGCHGNGVPVRRRARDATLVLKWKYLHWDNRVLVEQLVYIVTMVLTFSPFRKRNILKTLALMFLVAPSHCITAMGSLHPPSGTSSEHGRERQFLFSEMQA